MTNDNQSKKKTNKNYKIIAYTLLITLLSISILSISQFFLSPVINKSEQKYYNNQLTALLSDVKFNNKILNSKINLHNNKYLKYLGGQESATIYIAKYNNIPTAVIIQTTTPDGYNGNIDLLVAIKIKDINNKNNKVIKVKILNHQETPGLGDLIDPEKSDWLEQFTDQDIESTDINQWILKQPNANFDSISGATITSQAVTNAIKLSLLLIIDYPEIIK